MAGGNAKGKGWRAAGARKAVQICQNFGLQAQHPDVVARQMPTT